MEQRGRGFRSGNRGFRSGNRGFRGREGSTSDSLTVRRPPDDDDRAPRGRGRGQESSRGPWRNAHRSRGSSGRGRGIYRPTDGAYSTNHGESQNSPDSSRADSWNEARTPVSKLAPSNTAEEPVSTSESDSVSSPSAGAISHRSSTYRGGGISGGHLAMAGTKGKPTIVEANYFAIENFSSQRAFHYDVTFNPEKPKRLLNLVINEFSLKHFPKKIIAFDGRKNIYSMTPLTNDEKVIKDRVKIYNEEKRREMQFIVALKLVAHVDLSNVDQRCIQVLEIVLRSAAAKKYVSIGRSFFSFQKPPTPILEGLEVRVGTHISVKYGEKLYLNVNTVHKPFLKPQLVLDLIREICASNFQRSAEVNFHRPLQRDLIFRMKDMLKGSRVSYTTSKGTEFYDRVYTVNDISFIPACKLRFEYNGQDITVEEYFKYEKKTPLEYTNLPCLNVGTSRRPQYLPIELCTVVEGQVVTKKLSNKQTSAIIQNSITDAYTRKNIINNEIQHLDLNNSPQIREFEVNINPEFQSVNARILNSPLLEYQSTSSQPKNGEWRSGSAFFKGATLQKWTVIILNNCLPHEDVNDFTDALEKEGKKMGLTINRPYAPKSINAVDLESCLKSCYLEKFELVFVMGSKSKQNHSRVKKIAELMVGLLTQYVTDNAVRRKMDRQKIIHNIIQKVNAKLGGVNFKIKDSDLPPKFSNAAVMYVGADVTHPTGDEAGTPSVAAVCASHDETGFQFNKQIRIQEARKEIITDLEEIMNKHLQFYEKNMGKKPEIILFFRDGVGEGQFQEVQTHELSAIQRACSNSNIKPAITFLVVQKRHHTRFFPTQQDCKRNSNVPPGTIIDTTITNPNQREFFLVSHSSPRGLCRPCRYHCLWDDNNLTQDELQAIVYYSCFTYSRCERSVSYPVATYYAHHAATRGKTYLYEECPSNYNNKFLEKHSSVNEKLKPMHFA